MALKMSLKVSVNSLEVSKASGHILKQQLEVSSRCTETLLGFSPFAVRSSWLKGAPKWLISMGFQADFMQIEGFSELLGRSEF